MAGGAITPERLIPKGYYLIEDELVNPDYINFYYELKEYETDSHKLPALTSFLKIPGLVKDEDMLYDFVEQTREEINDYMKELGITKKDNKYYYQGEEVKDVAERIVKNKKLSDLEYLVIKATLDVTSEWD